MDSSNSTTPITINSYHNVLDDVCSKNNLDTTREIHFGIGSDGNLNFVTSSKPPTSSLDVNAYEDELSNEMEALFLKERIYDKASGSSRKKALAINNEKFKRKHGKRSKKNDECHYCHGMGHWLRNCPIYLEHVREGLVLPLGNFSSEIFCY